MCKCTLVRGNHRLVRSMLAGLWRHVSNRANRRAFDFEWTLYSVRKGDDVGAEEMKTNNFVC